jgi:hypothetical protein
MGQNKMVALQRDTLNQSWTLPKKSLRPSSTWHISASVISGNNGIDTT